MAQVDFKENGLYGGNHGSSKTRKELMAVTRDDGQLTTLHHEVMVLQ